MNQDRPYTSRHEFSKGYLADLHPVSMPAEALSDGQNFHFLAPSDESNQYLLQTNQGNVYQAALPANWVILGSRAFRDVLYLVMAEVQDGQATGWGQIGSFPSPVPGQASAELERVYRPLHNFTASGAATPGEFIAREFNFSLDKPVQVEVQPDYDGTVNLILNDNYNSPRIINSRFEVLEGGRYQIKDRDGMRDTNLYVPANFSDTILLFQKSRSLVACEFVGLQDGGQLEGGCNQYFFQYVNQDGLATDVIAWSPLIYIYDGDTAAGVRGTSEKTTRRVRLQLTGLDLSYQFLRVVVVRSSGEQAAEGVEAFTLPNVRLTSDTLTLTHTGFEKTLPFTVAELNIPLNRFDTFRSITQASSRLILAGPTEKVYDLPLFTQFARSIELGYKEVKIPSFGSADDGETSGSGGNSPFVGFSDTLDEQGRPGGYANPWNAANRRSYGSGESYPFGIVVLLDDGQTYPIPCRGHDMIFGRQPFDPALPADSEGWKENGENETGVLRFPQNSERSALLSSDGRYVQVLGVTFRIPQIPADILAKSRGCYFVRGRREPDRLCQGYAVATINSLLVSPDGQPFDYLSSAFQPFQNNQGLSGETLKVLPAIGGVIEAAVRDYRINNPAIGAYSIQVAKTAGGRRNINPYRLAFYSPDTMANPNAFRGELNGRNLRMCEQGKVVLRPVEQYRNGTQNRYSFTVWKTVRIGSASSFNPRITAYWTEAGVSGTNAGRFGSYEKDLVVKDSSDVRWLVQGEWNAYVGLVGQGTVMLDPANQLSTNQAAVGPGTGFDISESGPHGTFFRATPTTKAFLVNLYPQHTENDNQAGFTNGARPREVLKELYSSDSIEWFPITQKMTWAQLQAGLDENGDFVAYEGDCFTSTTYKRLSQRLPANVYGETKYLDSPIMQALSMVCESHLHPHLRIPEVQARPGDGVARSFYPYLVSQNGQSWATIRTREFRGFETEGYQAGGMRVDGHLIDLSLPKDLPYKATRYPNQLLATSEHLPGGFENGYRTLNATTSQQYLPELGDITGIGYSQGRVIVGFEKGVAAVGLNEQTQTAENSGGPVYIEIKQVLSPNAQELSREIGLLSPWALLVTDYGVYGLDYKGLWRIGGNGGLEQLSVLHVNSRLRPALKLLGSFRGEQVLRREARLAWDSSRGDVLVNVLVRSEQEETAAKGSTPVGPTYNKSLLLAYSQRLELWLLPMSWYNQHVVSLGEDLLSVPVSTDTRLRPGLFKHQGNFGRYYDRPHECFIEVCVSPNQGEQQFILDNLLLITNEVYPERVAILDEEGSLLDIKVVGPAPRNISVRNAEYRENRLWITLPPKVNGQRARGRVLRLRLYYTGAKQVQLHRLLTWVTDSYS